MALRDRSAAFWADAANVASQIVRTTNTQTATIPQCTMSARQTSMSKWDNRKKKRNQEQANADSVVCAVCRWRNWSRARRSYAAHSSNVAFGRHESYGTASSHPVVRLPRNTKHRKSHARFWHRTVFFPRVLKNQLPHVSGNRHKVSLVVVRDNV